MVSVLFLCAGYGTRLTAEVQGIPEYEHLSNKPKGLVPLAGKPLLSWWMEHFTGVNAKISAKDLFFITNDLYRSQMIEWAAEFGIPASNITSDGQTTNVNGSLGSLMLAYQNFKLSGKDLVVIASDTLFLDFDLNEFVQQCQVYKSLMVVSYRELTSDEYTKKCGILECDGNSRVISFLEKPAPETTRSRKACPCFYYCRGDLQQHLSQYLSKKTTETFSLFDAPGHFVRYLAENFSVYAIHIPKIVEVGDLQSFKEADSEVVSAGHVTKNKIN